MADGNAVGQKMYATPSGKMSAQEIAEADLLVPGPGWAKTMDRGGFGACGELGIDRNGLEWMRYSRFLVKFTRDPATGALNLAAPGVGGGNIKAFDGGITDGPNVDGYPWTLSQTENDLFQTGAPGKFGYSYEATAASIDVDDVYALRDLGAGGFAKSISPAANFYRERLRRMVWLSFAWQLTYAESECQWIGGLFKSFPPPGGIGGSDYARNGSGIGPSNIWPLRRRIVMGSQLQGDQANINMVQPQAVLRVEQDTTLTDSDLFVEVTMAFYGRKVFSCGAGCMPAPCLGWSAQKPPVGYVEQFQPKMAGLDTSTPP